MDKQLRLDRRTAVRALLEKRGETLVISGLGSSTWDVNAAGDHPGNFYLWGAMGGAALIGLGLAKAQPKRPVLVITGDGEQLMGVGGLATIAQSGVKNLAIAVLDNAEYGETGRQKSQTGRGLDLVKVAAACGIPKVARVGSPDDLKAFRDRLASPGPQLAVIEINADVPPRSLPSRDAIYLKNRFREHLGIAAP
jgi:thiamine pyrophosphate-dependent acetolactate synthase large subunit-like protein